MKHLANTQAMGGLPINRAGMISFFDVDHGDGRGPEKGGALAWLMQTLYSEGICDIDGEVWLQTYPRMLGYAFKPVSFWYCHRSNGSLRAIVAEVNNTFGERHCYLLDHAHFGHELEALKCFHVSPFCQVQGRYRFRFMRTTPTNPLTSGRLVARVDHDDDAGPLIQTSISGHLHVIQPQLINKTLLRFPAMTLLVMLRIHWQALQLWLKRVHFFKKPPPPAAFMSRSNHTASSRT